MTLQNSMGYGLNHRSARYITLLADSNSNPSNPDESPFPKPPDLPYPTPPKPDDEPRQIQPQPAAPTPPPPPSSPSELPKSMSAEGKGIKIAGAAIAVIIVLGIIYFIFSSQSHPVTTATTTALSSTPTALSISSCTTIAKPGTYDLAANINTGILNGSCIRIASSDVSLDGEGHTISGNGPYSNAPPYTSGISLDSVSGVNVSGVTITKFSYGVYLNNSNGNRISNVSMSNITITGMYLEGSQFNLLDKNIIESVNGQGGAISLQGGNNTVSDSMLRYNSYYGIVINSTGNKIENDTLVGNPVDLLCSTNAGYISVNRFLNTSCYVNDYCNFATCSESNEQANPKSTILQPTFNGCGSINYPGTYSLSQDVNIGNFINVGTGSMVPCITVNASSVSIDCNGHTISNGPYGIYAMNAFNVTVSDCSFSNDTYGLYFNSILKFNLHNITASNGVYGVYTISSTGGNFTNINAAGNKYGIYVNKSTYTTLTRFNTTGNSYGVAIDNSTSIAMDQGSSQLNTASDVYCTASSYNSTLSTISDTQCGSTDCIWAYNSCPIHKLPSLAVIPVSQCATLSIPGQYSMDSNLVSQGSCFSIDASNVSLQCNNHIIDGFNTGTAITVVNATNVALFNCRIDGFGTGISASNDRYLVTQNVQINKVDYGIELERAQSAIIANDTVLNFSNAGYSFAKVDRSIISGDFASQGQSSSAPAFLFTDAVNNTVVNNTAFRDFGYGFSFQNGTRSNFIKNNTASQDSIADYACSPDSSGLYTNTGNINYGITKQGCRWLAAVPPSSLQNECTLIRSPSLLTLQYDAAYTYGGTCYEISSVNATVNARNTLVNCEGHTIVATDGGTFIDILNTSSVTIENCIFKGFTTPIVVSSKVPQSGIVLLNDTMADSGTAIASSGVQSLTISDDNISNATTGVSIAYANMSTIQDNLLNRVVNGIVISFTVGATLTGNQANATGNALSLVNATQIAIHDNTFEGTGSGVYCSVSSASASSTNVDSGGNVCNSNSCSWITSSSCK